MVSLETGVGELLRDAVAPDGELDAAAVGVLLDGRQELSSVAGFLDSGRLRAATADSWFDLASISKPFLATLALHAAAAGEIALEAKAGPRGPAARARLRDLLRHRAGLVPWAPLYALELGPGDLASPSAPGAWWRQAGQAYSDLGYLLAGHLLTAVMGDLGAALVRELPWAAAAGLGVQPGGLEGVVACRMDTGKEVELARAMGLEIAALGPPPPGTSQDGNARWLGGFPGHAGLFGSVAAMLTLGEEWRSPARLDGAAVRQALSGAGELVLGWRRASYCSSAARLLGEGAFCHTGFTGGGLWVDPQRRLVIALAAHRRDPLRSLQPWRRRLVELVVSAIPAT